MPDPRDKEFIQQRSDNIFQFAAQTLGNAAMHAEAQGKLNPSDMPNVFATCILMCLTDLRKQNAELADHLARNVVRTLVMSLSVNKFPTETNIPPLKPEQVMGRVSPKEPTSGTA